LHKLHASLVIGTGNGDTEVYFGIGKDLARRIAKAMMEQHGAAFYARITYPNGEIETVPYIEV